MRPSNLALSATKSGATFNVLGTWSAASKATRYNVRLTSSGVVVDSAFVTTLGWVGHTNAADGTSVTMTVTSYNGTRKGRATSRNLVLPDLTAPAVSYNLTHNPAPDGRDVSLAVTATDNVTATGALKVDVTWGDGTSANGVSIAAALPHQYPDGNNQRFEGNVRVQDQAGNVTNAPFVSVVNDTTAPHGTFGVAPAAAWTSWTKVAVTTSDIGDNLTPADLIVRKVDWKDGTTSQWTGSTSPTHTYTVAGVYQPTIVLTDEATRSSAPQVLGTVTVTTDAAKPVIRLTPPRTRKAYVSSWRTLTGRASDGQTGVRNVVLRAIEKRGAAWYAYKASTHTWVKTASKAAAWRTSVAASIKPASTGKWSYRVAGLTKGTLIYRARSYDNRGNYSGLAAKKAVLTKR